MINIDPFIWIWLYQRKLLCYACEGKGPKFPRVCECCLGTGIPPIPLSALGL